MKHGAKFSGAQSKAAFPEGIRHSQKSLFRCTHNNRQHHDGQSQRTRQQRIPPFTISHKEQHSKQTIYNRGNSCQRFCRHTDNTNQLISLSGVLHQIDGGKDAKRNCHNKSRCRHQQCVNKCRHHGNIFRCICPRKQFRFQMRNPMNQNIYNEISQNKDRNHCCYHRHQK